MIQAAAGHVAIRSAQAHYLLREREFRADFQPIYDREKVRSQFTMSLANLAQFRAYWMAGLRKIVARSVSCSRQFRVPEGARYIGTYAEPCRVEDFFADLDQLISEAAEAPDARGTVTA